jgi:hypothetical protein
MEQVRVERADLEPVLAEHTGNRTWEQTLGEIGDGRGLLRVLGRYIYFNASFGGGVANLAGEIAVRQDLFRDANEPVSMLADRSVEVAADIFAAAIDEFGDPSIAQRGTHRSLAQATLKAAGKFWGLAPDALDPVVRPTAALQSTIQRVRQGYGVNQSVDAEELFRGIGFHLGSEILADEEFRMLDAYLRESQKELVAHLERSEEEIGSVRCPAYLWIRIHTHVEADHFVFAVQGANRALGCFVGQQGAVTARDWILAGFREFAAVQTAFMDGLSATAMTGGTEV